MFTFIDSGNVSIQGYPQVSWCMYVAILCIHIQNAQKTTTTSDHSFFFFFVVGIFERVSIETHSERDSGLKFGKFE